MFSKKFICFLLLIIILSMGIVTAQDVCNQTQGVDDDAILSRTIEIDDDSFENITSKINGAKDNDIIEFSGERILSNQFNINKSVTIQGSENLTKIYHATFNIDGGNVTIRNLCFYYASDSFNVIQGKNEKLTVVNCSFEYYNSIFFTGEDLSIMDCTFKNAGVAVDFRGKNIKIENCKFENTKNSAIYCYANSLTVVYSNFTNCSGIFVDESLQVILKNNKFRNTPYGNVIKNSNMVTVENNYFRNDGLEFNGNKKAIVMGNELHNSYIATSDDLQISNCDFLNSTFVSDRCKEIRNCRFVNVSGDYALFNEINIIGCLVINSSFDYLMVGQGNVVNSIFINNTAESLFYGTNTNYNKISDSKFIANTLNNYLFEYGECKNVVINSCVFKNNTASKNLLKLFEIKNTTLAKSIFENNHCPKLVEIRYLDGHIGYNDPITTSFEVTNNMFFEKGYKLSLEPLIASNEYNTKLGTNVRVADNFYGRNFKYEREIEIMPPSTIVGDWLNVDLVKTNNNYQLKFVNTKGNTPDLPDCHLSLKDKNTGEIILSDILVKSGSATFKTDKNLSLDNVFVLDESSNIINKPEANLTYIVEGRNYDDFRIVVYLKNNTEPLKNQNVYYEITQYCKGGIKESDGYSIVKTDGEGKIIISNWPYNEDHEIQYHTLNVWFSDNEFSMGELSISNIKIDKVNAKLTVKSISIPYFSDISIPITLSEISLIPVEENTKLEYSIYKNKKLIYKTDIYSYNGKFKVYSDKIRKLDVGKYDIVVRNVYGKYVSVKKTATVKITKASTIVNAPKVTNKFKKSKYFKVTLKNKASKKAAGNVVLKLQIGKKTYNVRTNSKGIAQFNTKKLAIGTYKVKITSGNLNYNVKAASQIKIKR